MRQDDFMRILKIVDSYETGQLTMQTGDHEIEVLTRRTPAELWIRLDGESNLAVCHAELNTVNYQLTTTGFIFYAHVVSENFSVNWEARFAEEV